ncbi:MULTISPECIES: hypothetical protein [unclassified Curtobacterium]|uniref:hypothetical protein n=1 Tax=unclassified Curtobacterium TaxID=257496 RepID=UPI000DA93BB0|nr:MULTISPECIES: hypothetical protein [unclassified Curtobacterium]PZF39644.1 hypothetical protein DEJ07_11900 [Curtobacterium sp. MCLR17_053]PZF48815.1 hypothetical protein DEJ06_12215 [Curtobacterium sp. MCLR17_051]
MALFRLEPNALVEQPPATFRELHLYERGDIQRLLRAQPEALGEELLVISEEFGNWEDSRRRIDLLALDRAANLVVIELKRTEDGATWSSRPFVTRRWSPRCRSTRSSRRMRRVRLVQEPA